MTKTYHFRPRCKAENDNTFSCITKTKYFSNEIFVYFLYLGVDIHNTGSSKHDIRKCITDYIHCSFQFLHHVKQCKVCKLKCMLLIWRLTGTGKICLTACRHIHTMHRYSLEQAIFVKLSRFVHLFIRSG